MSNPACCPPGSWPMLTNKDASDDAFEPKGKVITIQKKDGKDLKIYCVAPSSSKSNNSNSAVIVLQDIYSIRLFTENSASVGRIPAICDALAESLGCLVVLPDLFGSNSSCGGPFDVMLQGPKKEDGETWTTQNIFGVDGGPGWFAKNTYDAQKATIAACYEYTKSKLSSGGSGNSKIGALGFCFGSWLMTRAHVSEDSTEFQALVACHPATILETAVHGGDEVELLEKAAAKGSPMLFLCAGNDSDVFHHDKPGRAAVEKSGGRVSDYPDMVHGWVARGDASDDIVSRDVDKAIAEVVEFFKTTMISKD